MSTGRKSVLLIILILLCDQILKIWVKTHMEIGQEIHIFGNWGILHFIENNGMAFGMEMGGKPGKLILSESFTQHAVLFPHGGGYSSFLHGRVVDMFYFPIINTHWPHWSPFRPGEPLIFFRPVFNIADSSITCGVIAIVLFQKRMFRNLS